MTPDEAQRAIHDAEDLRANLPADCWRALETIVGMRIEWQVQRRVHGGWQAFPVGINTQWTDDKTTADNHVAKWRDLDVETRIVRRYVTEPEEA